MANYRALSGGILSTHIRLTDWKSFNANAVTSITTDYKPKAFILIVDKPTDSTQSVAYYTNINPDTNEIDETGKWWRRWNNNTTWEEYTTVTYAISNNSFTTSSGLSGYATIQGLIYTF